MLLRTLAHARSSGGVRGMREPVLICRQSSTDSRMPRGPRELLRGEDVPRRRALRHEPQRVVEQFSLECRSIVARERLGERQGLLEPAAVVASRNQPLAQFGGF